MIYILANKIHSTRHKSTNREFKCSELNCCRLSLKIFNCSLKDEISPLRSCNECLQHITNRNTDKITVDKQTQVIGSMTVSQYSYYSRLDHQNANIFSNPKHNGNNTSSYSCLLIRTYIIYSINAFKSKY